MTAQHPLANRRDLIGAAFAEHAERVHRTLAARCRPETRDLAADACSFAWMRLVVRADIPIDPDRRYLGWLYTVARHEHLALVRRGRETLSLDCWNISGLNGDGEAPLDRLPGPEEPHTLAEQREQLALLDELPPVRREALLLQAAGHSYADIGDLMGLSQRQVTRYLNEGSRRVRQLHRERSEVPRGPPEHTRTRGTTRPPIDLDLPTTHDLELDLDL